MKKFRRNLAMLTVLPFLLFGNSRANAEDLEKKVSPFSINNVELNFDYNYGSESELVDYQTVDSRFNLEPDYLNLSSDTFELNETEQTQIQEILINIKNEDIETYSNLLEISQDLTENQKLVLLGAVGSSLNKFGYNLDLLKEPLLSKEEVFERMQYSLSSGEKEEIGVCGHIATFTAQLANDLGTRASAVTGIAASEGGHAFCIAKTSNSTSIVDYGHLYFIDTKNIEKALKIYQKEKGISEFEHVFCEDGKFQYRLTTEGGKNLFNFMEFDETLNETKERLIFPINPQPDLTISQTIGNFLNSTSINYKGFVARGGKIIGGDASALQSLEAIQIGYEKNFITSNGINLQPSLRILRGRSFHDLYFMQVGGITLDLLASTNSEKNLNLAGKISGATFGKVSPSIVPNFLRVNGEIGISYKSEQTHSFIEPYALSQIILAQKESFNQYSPRLSELNMGLVLNAELNNSQLTFDPYFTKRIWEYGFGANVSVENKNFELNLEGEKTISSYDFCPNKYNLSGNLSLILPPLTLKASYEFNQTDYDGEIDNQESFNMGGSIKF